MDTLLETQERHVFIINNDKRRAFALEAAAYSIGRDESNAIVLDFETISRQHAMLLRVPVPHSSEYQYRILDGNAQGKPSANGIYINGEKVKSHKLNNGDTIQFGQHVTAAYLKLSMGEAEFVNYLESISFQSLKSKLVDAKATRVAVDVNDKKFDIDTILGANTDQTILSVSTNPTRSSSFLSTDTLHDGEFEVNAESDRFLLDANPSTPVSTPASASTSASTPTPASPNRSWLYIVGGLVVLLLGASGLLLFKSSTAPAPSQTGPNPALGTAAPNS